MPGTPWFWFGGVAEGAGIASLVPSQDDIQIVLRDFLLAICPGVEVVEGWDNRVPEPKGDNYIVFWPIRRKRLATNYDKTVDAAFIGSINGNVLTITEVLAGRLDAQAQLYGLNIVPGTTVVAMISGEGGVGTYQLDKAQNLGPTIIQTGTQEFTQSTDVTFQIEPHGPKAADMAQTISTMFRDNYAFEFFEEREADIYPLHADDPNFVPFQNDQNQVEFRWIVMAHVQADQTNKFPQQFMTAIEVNLIEVDTTYRG